MKNRLTALILTLAVTIACPQFTLAQSQPATATPAAGHAADLTGVWMSRGLTAIFDPADPRFSKPDTMPMQPWAEAKFKATKPGYGPYATAKSEDPTLNCYPPGMPLILLVPFPVEIIQAPGRVLMYFEFGNHLRQIYTDGRGHPQDVMPTYMGHSIGKWEGDTLVVDTVGLTDKSWIDRAGHPHSEALHIVERIRRVNRDNLQFDLTFDDPKAYTKPWTGKKNFTLVPDGEIMEYVCVDNFIKAPPKTAQ
jgi:hypothetical protein